MTIVLLVFSDPEPRPNVRAGGRERQDSAGDNAEAVLELEQEILQHRCRSVKAVRIFDLRATSGAGRPRGVYRVGCTRGGVDALIVDESGCALVQKPFEVEKFLGVIRQALSQPAVCPVKR